MNRPNPTDSPKLTPRQSKAVMALLSGFTVAQAAKEAGVTRQTVSEWRRLPHFKAALEAAERDGLSDLSNLLGQLSRNAAVVLGQIMMSPKASDAVRVRAAGLILARRLQALSLVDIERELRRLEEEAGTGLAEGWGWGRDG
ncbi:MAG: hypothetical protein M3Q03_13535 [Chloroflexota bacterium]|nr:hypothetical protein [Chloroflexota bacterium]